jgi:predicted alpha/beta hydrolase
VSPEEEPAATGFKISDVTFLSTDGAQLRGTVYRPDGLAQPQVCVVITSGIGIAAVRYHRFAAYLASRGIGVLTFDYRGVGRSSFFPPRQESATLEDWAEWDVSGAIFYCRSAFPGAEVVGIAHSFGAFLLLCSPETQHVSRIVLVCAHTGFPGDYHIKYMFPMVFVWHLIMPLIAHIIGYFPGRSLGLGENLPKKVAIQWSSRIRSSFATTSSRTRSLLAQASGLEKSVLAVRFENDGFASHRGERRLFSYAPRLRVRRLKVQDSTKMPLLGHFGFFRATCPRWLWDEVAAYVLLGDI